jgi:hypothetical protein
MAAPMCEVRYIWIVIGVGMFVMPAAGEHGQLGRNRAIAAADGGAVRSKPPHRSPAVSLATYREDPLYPRIARAVAAMLQQGTVVAPVHVLVGMDLLAQEHLEAWRRGRVRCLEEVITCNLTRLSLASCASLPNVNYM